MRQHSNLAKDTAEKVVKDIRRATRKQYSAEEKIIRAHAIGTHRVAGNRALWAGQPGARVLAAQSHDEAPAPQAMSVA
jgi:hypothetical protein